MACRGRDPGFVCPAHPSNCNLNLFECANVCACRYDGLEGYPEPGAASLAVCLDNGRMQLMTAEVDDQVRMGSSLQAY